MAKIRHLFPGGNTCRGFHSFYDHIAAPSVKRKMVLKGGPGVGKSTFMSRIGEDFARQGFNLEYHWCSSDNNSLDAVVMADHQFCLVDGTSPHVVDPVYPGAVDEIINLGQYWEQKKLQENRSQIIDLTSSISNHFQKAYRLLEESNLAYQELHYTCFKALNIEAVRRNIQALTADILPGATASSNGLRHLFAGAITPKGLICKMDSIIDEDMALFAVKGPPGSGKNELFSHLTDLLTLSGIAAQIYHNPLNPDNIDVIIIPSNKAVLIDIGSILLPYETLFSGRRYKRLLDFEQFVNKETVDAEARMIYAARSRMDDTLQEAVACIHTAKKYHDVLEKYYIAAMDFEAVEAYRQKLSAELLEAAVR